MLVRKDGWYAYKSDEGEEYSLTVDRVPVRLKCDSQMNIRYACHCPLNFTGVKNFTVQ